jgi:hypothetical protein
MSTGATTIKAAARMHNPAHPGAILRELYQEAAQAYRAFRR